VQNILTAGVKVFNFLHQFSTTRSKPLYALGCGHILERTPYFLWFRGLSFFKLVEIFQKNVQKSLAGGDQLFDIF
jgi:hypothetical protein